MRRLALLLALLLLAARSPAAEAATLEQIRVFAGAHHARVLLVTRGVAAGLDPRASPAMGAAPARGIVVLQGTTLGGAVAHTIPVEEHGILRLLVADTAAGAQVTAEMEGARGVRATPLGKNAVLVDLIEEGHPEDPGLPTAQQLQAWVEGTALVPADAAPPRTRRLIVVDAGHGGFDHGAVGTTGTREADIALQIAKRAALGLEEKLGADVVLTRDTDVFIPLRERAAIANQRGADLFLSVHCNAAPAPTAWGIETYSLDTASDAGAARVAARENTLVREAEGGEGMADPLLANLLVAGTNQLSRDLSAEIQTHVVRELRAIYGTEQIRDLGTKTALFYVLVSTRMPAVLFESSFVSNPGDERRLRTPAFQAAVADALVGAVERWFARQG